jgi:hypothetical protein
MDKTFHIGEEIKKQLKIQERSIAWLAKKVCCDPSDLGKQLKRQHINTALLYRIAKVLKVDFFAYFSNQLLVDEKNMN